MDMKTGLQAWAGYKATHGLLWVMMGVALGFAATPAFPSQCNILPYANQCQGSNYWPAGEGWGAPYDGASCQPSIIKVWNAGSYGPRNTCSGLFPYCGATIGSDPISAVKSRALCGDVPIYDECGTASSFNYRVDSNNGNSATVCYDWRLNSWGSGYSTSCHPVNLLDVSAGCSACMPSVASIKKPSDGLCAVRQMPGGTLEQDPLDPDCTPDLRCTAGNLELEKNLGAPEECGVGNPINPGTGNKYQAQADYRGSGVFPLQYIRHYNSQTDGAGRMGHGWRAFGGISIISPDFVKAIRPDQRTFGFTLVDDGWVADADITARLIRRKDAGGTVTGWELALPDGTSEHYDPSGTITAIRHPSGQAHVITNAASSHVLVTDSFNRTLTLDYNAENRLERLTDPSGGVTTYAYDATGNLVSVTYPDGAGKNYHYENPTLPHALTGITDENGHRYATYVYDAQGRATISEHAGSAERVELTYNPDGTAAVTDALGTARTYGFETVLGMVKGKGISQPGGAGCNASSSAISHDANGNVATRDDFNGHRTRYWHDLARNLETTRVEGLAIENGDEVVKPETRTFTTTWDPIWRLPTVEKTYTGGADSAGVPLGILVKTVASTYDASGNLRTLAETDNLRNETRTWTYTWNTLGRIKKANGPRTDVADVTTYAYYPDDDPDLGRRGQLWKTTNALGHVTEILAYDLRGHPTRVRDPNGLITEYTYTARGWLKTRLVGERLTTYTYDKVGQLTRVDFLDGASLEYTYDAAHRLTGIRNAQGERIRYELDAQGNILVETVLDAQGNQSRKLTRQYDALGRLWKDIRRINGQDAVTEYGYDAQGNHTVRVDPLAHATRWSHDLLDRLAGTEDALQGRADLTRDVLDQITVHTDPNRFATTYDVDAFGRVRSETSPDRGVTTYTYDPAGNLKTRTDARGKTITYRYDALNRLTRIDRPVGKDSIFTWDQGANALGRLTGMTDESGATAWNYNPHGETTTRTQTHVQGGALTRAVGATYLNGQRTRLDYPSGAYAEYTWNQGRITAISVNGTPLLEDIQYQPFGAPMAWTWGNGRRYGQGRDPETGWTSSYPLGTDTRALAYDAAGRIAAYTHNRPGLNQSFDYDGLDRLTGLNTNQGGTGWDYDANGNRSLHRSGSADYLYTYALDSNRLQSVDGPVARNFQYDAAGNVIHDGTYGYTYNDFGRLGKLAWDTKTTAYHYNGLGERVLKTGRGTVNGPVHYVYDEDGKLLGEYDKLGAIHQETIWLYDRPVGVVTGTDILYVYADHLNAPRVLTDTTNKTVWLWNGDAYGVGATHQDPDQDGVKVVYNPRFPGQYFDRESGLHYNYFRDYDPRVGRYVEADPIGLVGGINLYQYARLNPLSYADPDGLHPLIGVAIASAAVLFDVTSVANGEPPGGGLGMASGKAAGTACKAAEGEALVIGRLKDLSKSEALRSNEYKLGWESKLPNWRAEWRENAGRLRRAMAQGKPIRDASPGDTDGIFLEAERNLLRNRGWTFDPKSSYWMPPTR